MNLFVSCVFACRVVVIFIWNILLYYHFLDCVVSSLMERLAIINPVHLIRSLFPLLLS